MFQVTVHEILGWLYKHFFCIFYTIHPRAFDREGQKFQKCEKISKHYFVDTDLRFTAPLEGDGALTEAALLPSEHSREHPMQRFYY